MPLDTDGKRGFLGVGSNKTGSGRRTPGAAKHGDTESMSTTATLRTEAEARANARLFRSEQAKKALTEYQSQQLAQDAKTAKLRSLRLAKEAQEAEEAAATKTPAKRKSRAKTPPKP